MVKLTILILQVAIVLFKALALGALGLRFESRFDQHSHFESLPTQQ